MFVFFVYVIRIVYYIVGFQLAFVFFFFKIDQCVVFSVVQKELNNNRIFGQEEILDGRYRIFFKMYLINFCLYIFYARKFIIY